MLGFVLMALSLVAAIGPAEAHPGHTYSFLAGLHHPVHGLDHLAAMVAVGLWTTVAGSRCLWFWPTAFVCAMLAGGALALGGLELPYAEPAIAASVVILGLLVGLLVKAPPLAGAVMIAAFGIAHGYAHGLEAPDGAWPPYAAGFALATAALHVTGIALGAAVLRIATSVPRALGLATAAAGLLALVK